MNKTWVEQMLERRLRPVTAPDELWDRVQSPRRPKPVFAWKIALAAMLVVASAWAVHPRPGDSYISAEMRLEMGLKMPRLATPAPRCGSRAGHASTHDRGTTLLIARAPRFTAVGFQSGCLQCHEE